MIFFTTCGRGMEPFAKRELNEIENISNVKIISEGKLIFNLCSEKKIEKNHIIQQENKINESCTACGLNSEENVITQTKFSCKVDEISLLNLKLIEKVFYLIHYKSISHMKESEKYEGNTAIDLAELKYTNVMERIVQFKKNKKESIWTPCSNPDLCYAFLTRQVDKQTHFRNRPSKRKEEDHEINVPNKQYIKENSNTEAYQTNEMDTVCEKEFPLKTFRVSCRIRGKWREYYKPFLLTKSLTDSIVKDNPTWIPVNCSPDLDIYVNMNDEGIIVGAPLTDKPLSLRPYIPHIALRSTICYLMITKAGVRNGYTILDPMCGVGTILLEAAVNIKNIRIIASDICIKTLNAAQCNLRAVERKDFILSDCSNIPLQNDSVDAIMCDFPFGKKHVINSYQFLMSRFMIESTRVLRASSRLVLLVSSLQYTYFKEELIKEICGITLLESDLVSLGLTSAYVLTFEKTRQC